MYTWKIINVDKLKSDYEIVIMNENTVLKIVCTQVMSFTILEIN